MNRTRLFSVVLVAVLAIISFHAANAIVAGAAESALKNVRLTVPGADCASTGAAADTLLRGIDGVTSVIVDIEKTTADISYDPSRTSIESIKEIMKAGDYPVTAVDEIE